MLKNKLAIVKVRKQCVSRGFLFDEYYFSWTSFYTNLREVQARKSATKSCTHCSESLFREGHVSTEYALRGYAAQCGVCNGYSCRPWNPNSSVCPRIQECQRCLVRVERSTSSHPIGQQFMCAWVQK